MSQRPFFFTSTTLLALVSCSMLLATPPSHDIPHGDREGGLVLAGGQPKTTTAEETTNASSLWVRWVDANDSNARDSSEAIEVEAVSFNNTTAAASTPMPTIDLATPAAPEVAPASPPEKDAIVTTPPSLGPTIDVKKVSEAFGHLIGRNLSSPGFQFDLDSVITGMRDAAAGKESPMTDSEYEQTIATIQETVFHEMADINLRAANAFLAHNATQKGVVELDPGHLQILMLREGHGDAVAEHSSPTIHYTGRYLDGTIFGTTRGTNEPIILPLDQTIPGFSKGIVGMKEGERREIYIHPALGYGMSGHLAPNALLIFDVEVIQAQ